MMKTGGSILRWEPEQGVIIRVVNRKTQAIFSMNTETFFVYHFANAYENKVSYNDYKN